MIVTDMDRCKERIAEEERLGTQAATPEAGLAHFQTAMLYKAQLAKLARASCGQSATHRPAPRHIAW